MDLTDFITLGVVAAGIVGFAAMTHKQGEKIGMLGDKIGMLEGKMETTCDNVAKLIDRMDKIIDKKSDV